MEGRRLWKERLASAAAAKQPEGEDRLSALPDYVLLSILERVDDLRTTARTNVLSTRWRLLPWLLPVLNIDADDFIPAPHSEEKTVEANIIHDAMFTLTAATKSLFAKPQRESVVARLQLSLYLIDTFSSDIGPLICDAINSGLLKDLNLAILDENEPLTCPDSDMLKRAQEMDGFFRAYPSILHCLTTLSLYSVSFAELDMNHVLFECCTQLTHLSLSFCEAGDRPPWKIDAPNSKLRVLDFNRCCFQGIELISLPKLEKLFWVVWMSNQAPLSFGFVPSLEQLEMSHFLLHSHHFLKLSEVLHGTSGIHTLTLEFMGDTIWLQPETKQLASAFSKLRELTLLGIFVEFDLLWTITFLEAAPSLQMLLIMVYEQHACELVQGSRLWTLDKRPNPDWELDLCVSKNMLLRELHIVHFRLLEQQLTLVKVILERAPNLQTVVLNKDANRCDKCDAMALDAPSEVSSRPAFPRNEDEQDMVVRRVTDGTSFSGQIIFQ